MREIPILKFSRSIAVLVLLFFLPQVSLLAQVTRTSILVPHIVLGESWTTTIQIENAGVETYIGFLEAYADDGSSLPVLVNGGSTPGSLSLSIAPGHVQTFRLTQAGATTVGHARVLANFDVTPAATSILNATITFRFTSGGTLLDQVGLLPSNALQSGIFIAERNAFLDTGLAIAEVFNQEVTVTLRARDALGNLLDATAIVIPPLGHRSFFITERLAIPEQFIGTVELETTGFVSAMALKFEGIQFSVVEVSPGTNIYNFTLQVGADTFLGDFRLSFSGTYPVGWITFTDPQPDPLLNRPGFPGDTIT